jgi:PAS domain S-box-containing protein
MTEKRGQAAETTLLARLSSILRTRTFQYAAVGFLFGGMLTFLGYLVDYYSLYGRLPDGLSFPLVLGLHEVTPVHYFLDGFSILLGLTGGIVGWLQDRVLYYSSRLEELVAERTDALRISEERYALAARSANDGLWDWDLESGRVYYSPRWKHTLGCASEEVGTAPEDWFQRVHPDDLRLLKARIDSHLRQGTSRLEVEYRMRHADGSYRWMLARGTAVRDEPAGRPHRMAGSQTDIHERRSMEEQLMHQALHDSLTDLPNRTLFLDRLGHAFQRARERGERGSLALLILDVDEFKRINDSMGHLDGDHLLKEIPARIRECLAGTAGEGGPEMGSGHRRTGRGRLGWTLARMGGDEFIVLLEDIASVNEVTDVVAAIRDLFQKPFLLHGQELFITLSAGVVIGPGEYERPDDLVRDADTAMYRAKAGGRGGYEIFDQEMLARVQEQLRLETDLHLALERREFCLHYQPIIHLGTGGLAGFEALVRWEHPERGFIPPGKYVPLAEETGLILELGRWIFAEACHQFGSWRRAIPGAEGLTMSINLSRRQLQDPELFSWIETTVAESDVQPCRIHLEVTESLFMTHPEQVAGILLRLRAHGFRVAIDDFGTGHSSLATLQHLPADILKVDQSFVAPLGQGPTPRRIVATIVKLAEALGHEVVAEGIETDLQLAELKRTGCRLGQGYLFARPLTASDAKQLLRKHCAGPDTQMVSESPPVIRA